MIRILVTRLHSAYKRGPLIRRLLSSSDIESIQETAVKLSCLSGGAVASPLIRAVPQLLESIESKLTAHLVGDSPEFNVECLKFAYVISLIGGRDDWRKTISNRVPRLIHVLRSLIVIPVLNEAATKAMLVLMKSFSIGRETLTENEQFLLSFGEECSSGIKNITPEMVVQFAEPLNGLMAGLSDLTYEGQRRIGEVLHRIVVSYDKSRFPLSAAAKQGLQRALDRKGFFSETANIKWILSREIETSDCSKLISDFRSCGQAVRDQIVWQALRLPRDTAGLSMLLVTILRKLSDGHSRKELIDVIERIGSLGPSAAEALPVLRQIEAESRKPITALEMAERARGNPMAGTVQWQLEAARIVASERPRHPDTLEAVRRAIKAIEVEGGRAGGMNV